MLLRTLIASADAPLQAIDSALQEVGALVRSVPTIGDAHRALEKEPFDLVILEQGLDPEVVPRLIREFRALPDAPEVIVLVDNDIPEIRAELIKCGAYSVLAGELPEGLFGGALKAVAERRLDESRAQLRTIPDEDYRLDDYVTHSKPMHRVLDAARRVAGLDTTVLILGETGVGKGLLARSIHNESPRAKGPFISVNCGALTENLLEAELFGHERGAFTGADRARRGYFELAHTGTLFLDEIAEMPLHLQVKLLQVIEDRKVRPVGSEKRVDVDIRIIAATNRNLPEEVANRRFREDLFYRLNVVSLTLPPLRERPEDLTEIAESYIDHFRAIIGTPAQRFSVAATHAILHYPWPGNVRELANAIERAVIMASEEEIHVEDLAVDIQSMAPARMADLSDEHGPIETLSSWAERAWSDVRREVIEQAEIRYLRQLLETTGGRIGETAQRAGMDPRSLHQKMKKYALRKEDFRS